MSCGLPLEFFEDAPASVQRLERAAAERGQVVPDGEDEDAAAWMASLAPGRERVHVVRPVSNRGPHVYWIEVAPTDHSPRPAVHYLVTWRTWFELRRRGLLTS